ncbi:tail assembly chaperone [Tepidamorphus gemmatus]|uniref:Tail assembly chaperone n=1 Tax=Tepidamorphus gemmatus TaxID=747076 RepID=A0A4V2UZU3_9HYPH|nr:phage tail assembly chaperone [Tepidamorphus gemmatus]TCT12663.1 tail assembly chaperone [Tepidamorphus gemmatus]
MRLAADEITIKVGSETVRLRPTLRAAMRLEARHGGMTGLFRAIADGSLTVIADVISECSDRPTMVPVILGNPSFGGLHGTLDGITEPLIRLVGLFAGIDMDNPPGHEPAPADAPPVSFADYIEALFGIGTGWLGWTPEQTWNATPAEILAARKGRIAMLTELFGTGERPDDHDPRNLPDPGSVKAGIGRLKMLQASLAGAR